MKQDELTLLRPAKTSFILFSLGAGLLLNMLPWTDQQWMPDFVAVILVFWNINQPRRVGIGAAWILGLFMDVHSASLLGEHALGYSLLSYFAISLHRRVLWFSLGWQMMHLFPLFFFNLLVVLVVRMMVDQGYYEWSWFIPALSNTLAWPVVHVLLLAPQHHVKSADNEL